MHCAYYIISRSMDTRRKEDEYLTRVKNKAEKKTGKIMQDNFQVRDLVQFSLVHMLLKWLE